MKKLVLAFLFLFSTSSLFSQWISSGILTTDNKYRPGGIGIGYTTAPAFGTNKLMVNGISSSIGYKFTSYNYNNAAMSIDNTPIDKVLSLDANGNIYLAHGGSIFTKSGALNSNRSIGLNGFSFTFYDYNPDSNFLPIDVPPPSKFFTINNDGKVGIGPIVAFPSVAGTVNVSNYKLFVTGGILTEEIRVKTSSGGTWADYVFAKDYNLKPLSEVEKFIETNGHLPNVPNANQVKEEGINVGEMAKIQQEKIEELTLYLIEQNKINQSQAKEIEELKALMKILLESKQ